MKRFANKVLPMISNEMRELCIHLLTEHKQRFKAVDIRFNPFAKQNKYLYFNPTTQMWITSIKTYTDTELTLEEFINLLNAE
jgi:hypothetical protein